MTSLPSHKSLNYLRIVLQSALAAALCLGLPAGLLLWLILLQQLNSSAILKQAIALLQTNGLNSIFILAACSLLWSFMLGRISGYQPWRNIGLATALGIIVGWFSPLSNLDGWFGDKLPVHILYAVAMSGIVGSATLCVGLAYGILLRNARAALVLALATSLVSVITVLLIITLCDWLGIRVGTGNFAMSRVTVISLLISAITGGATLGVGFSSFVEEEKSSKNSQPPF